MKKILLTLMTFGSILATAEGTVANGGNATVCYTQTDRQVVTSIELFDYWEMDRTLHVPGAIQLGSPNLPLADKIKIFTDRVQKFDPVLAQSVAQIAQSMASRIQDYLVTSQQLPAIADYTPIALPLSPCYIEQFAVQWKNPVDGRYRFSISAYLFYHPLTTNDTRAGIILHEAIYRNAVLRGAKNSDGSRYFNYVMATNKLDSGNLLDYTSLLATTQLAALPKCAMKYFESFKRSFYVSDASICLPQEFTIGKIKFKIAPSNSYYITEEKDHQGQAQGTISVAGELQFETSPGVFTTAATYFRLETYKLGLEELPTISVSATLAAAGPVLQLETADQQIIPCRREHFTIGLNGEGILTCQPTQKMQLTIQGKQVSTDRLNHIQLDGAHNIRFIGLEDSAELRVENSTRKLVFDQYIFIGPNGGVVRGSLETPFVVQHKGHDAEVGFIDINPLTKMTEVKDHFNYEVDPRYQGRRILNDPDIYGDAGTEICKLKNYGTYGDLSSNFEEVYVSGVEQFYEPIEKKFVYRADENVSVMKNANCSESFWIQL